MKQEAKPHDWLLLVWFSDKKAKPYHLFPLRSDERNLYLEAESKCSVGLSSSVVVYQVEGKLQYITTSLFEPAKRCIDSYVQPP